MSKGIRSVSRTLFGGSDSSSQQSAQQSSSLDPRVFALMNQNYNRAQEIAFGKPGFNFFGMNVGGTPGLQARQFADFSGLQNQGFSALSGINQNAGMTGAQNALAGLQGMSFGADRINPMMVQAGSFLQGDIGAYQNPYTEQVINQSLADNDRARLMQQQGINAQALSRGAFGGSRQAIAEAENNRNFMDQQARTAAQLRNQGFDTAAGLMQADMNRALQAGISNQAAGLTAGTQNANNQLQAQQLRAGALQNALTGGLNLNQSFLGNIAAQMQAGGAQQQLEQQRMDAIRNLPLEQLQITSGALGLNPFGGAGNVSQGTSQGTSRAGSDKGLFGFLF